MPPLDQEMKAAAEHHRAGRLSEAETIYRRVLATHPGEAEAWQQLGTLAVQAGRPEAAAPLIERALAIDPANASAANDLGIALQACGRLPDAVTAYRRALRIEPDFAVAHNNLGNALSEQGQLEDAICSYREAVRLKPAYAAAHANLGIALGASGKLAEGLIAQEAAIRLAPNNASFHYNLGNLLKTAGRIEDAIQVYGTALQIDPQHPEVLNNLANTLQDEGRTEEAIAQYRKALCAKPNDADLHNNLGLALKACGELDEAVAALAAALRLRPSYVEALHNLGNSRMEQGHLDAAIECYRLAASYDPNAPASLSSLIYALSFHPDYNARQILAENRKWARRYEAPLTPRSVVYENEPATGRRLRVGYVSPDFRSHVVGRNILPLLQQHDHEQFEIYCYSNARRPDRLTARIRTLCDRWRDIADLSDEQTAEMIRADGIDILVDLTLHMDRNRLLVFSRKPAPVQVTYLGYCGTTGLETIDYRLSDPFLDPPGTDLSVYSETTMRLPRTYWCYEPGGPTPLAEPRPPRPHVTFGCLNNFAKVSPATLELWIKIIRAVPQSRLILHTPPGESQKRIIEQFSLHDITADRLELVGRRPWAEYVATLQQIDLALDSFPYSGGITTCDALWMGVPVITLAGRTAVGRGGCSILSNLGLTELIAETPEQYLELAVSLAQDPRRLTELRIGLRDRLEHSPLRDATGCARDLEAVYREMWRVWCRARG